MRVTFVAPTADFSGGCRVIATYARRLRDRGHTVQVVTRGTYRPLQKRLREFIYRPPAPPPRPEGPSSHYEVLGVPFVVASPNRPLLSWDVQDADVIVATWWETAEWIAHFPPSKGAKAYFIQGYEVHLPGQPAERVEATFKLPFHKLMVSTWLVDLMKRFGDDDVTSVPNSIDHTQFHAPPREKNACPTIGLIHGVPPLKGFDVARAVIADVRKRYPDLRVVAFGHEQPNPDNPLPPGTEFRCQPPQREIKDLYARCDVWLCTSRVEGFGLPSLEAMACRCPVVSTRVGGAMDIITPGKNGFLADVDDVSTLSNGVQQVLALEPAAWKQMSDAAYGFARSYDWDQATDRFHAGLERAIAKQARNSRMPQQLA